MMDLVFRQTLIVGFKKYVFSFLQSFTLMLLFYTWVVILLIAPMDKNAGLYFSTIFSTYSRTIFFINYHYRVIFCENKM